MGTVGKWGGKGGGRGRPKAEGPLSQPGVPMTDLGLLPGTLWMPRNGMPADSQSVSGGSPSQQEAMRAKLRTQMEQPQLLGHLPILPGLGTSEQLQPRSRVVP